MDIKALARGNEIQHQLNEINKILRASSVGEYWISDGCINDAIKKMDIEDEFINIIVKKKQELIKEFEEL